MWGRLNSTCMCVGLDVATEDRPEHHPDGDDADGQVQVVLERPGPGRIAASVGHHHPEHAEDSNRSSGSVVRPTAVARPRAQIHQATGWSVRGTRRAPARLQRWVRTDIVSRPAADAKPPGQGPPVDGFGPWSLAFRSRPGSVTHDCRGTSEPRSVCLDSRSSPIVVESRLATVPLGLAAYGCGPAPAFDRLPHHGGVVGGARSRYHGPSPSSPAACVTAAPGGRPTWGAGVAVPG